MVEFFHFMFLLFDQDFLDFMTELFEDDFFQLLSKNSIKKLQISFGESFECCSISSSVGKQTSLKERLVNLLKVEGFSFFYLQH